MKTAILALFCAALFSAETPKPEPRALSTDQQLRVARLQAKIFRAQAEAQQAAAAFEEARRILIDADKEYKAALDDLRKEQGAQPGCNLDEKQAWKCGAPPTSANGPTTEGKKK